MNMIAREGTAVRKPKNLKEADADTTGFTCISSPYVYCDFTMKPLRVTLDGEFGIQDLEWIIEKMIAHEGAINANN